jgi:hypothetical protein
MITRRAFIVPLALFSILLVAATGCKTSPPSAPVDTPPTVSITSPVQNDVLRLTDTVFVSATDDRGVTKVELYVNGSLAATDSASPWRFIWNTELWDDGSYTLQAKAYDAAGHSTASTSVSITISNAFPVTFINTTRTPISVTAYRVTRTIDVNDSTIYTLSTNPRNLIFTASTSGKTSTGTVIGLTLSWGGSSNPINVSSLTYVRISLEVPSTYFFMYMRNWGKKNTYLGPIYVNYGTSDQTTDNVSVPPDSLVYSIGYYKAFTSTVVRAYWSSPTTSYTQWSSIPFPWTTNQAIIFGNPYPTSQVGVANAGEPEGRPGFVAVQPSPSRLRKQAGGGFNSNSLVVLPNE